MKKKRKGDKENPLLALVLNNE